MVAICDEEADYMERLREYYESKDNFPFQICTFREEKALLGSLLKNNYEMIILSEKQYALSGEELQKRKKGEALVILSARESERLYEKEIPYILKYQSAENIRKELLVIYAENADKPAFTKGSHEGILIGLYSPIKRSMQTKISLLIGQILAKNRKVLYLNLEPFAGKQLLPAKGEKNLSDLLYYMKSDEEKTLSRLESMLSNIAGVDYIPPAFSLFDLKQVGEDDWKKLFEIIKNAKKYDYIIVDYSELVEGLFEQLRSCDKVFTMIESDETSKEKINHYTELLSELGYEDVLDHSMMVKTPSRMGTLPSLTDLYGSELCSFVRQLVEEEITSDL